MWLIILIHSWEQWISYSRCPYAPYETKKLRSIVALYRFVLFQILLFIILPSQMQGCVSIVISYCTAYMQNDIKWHHTLNLQIPVLLWQHRIMTRDWISINCDLCFTLNMIYFNKITFILSERGLNQMWFIFLRVNKKEQIKCPTLSWLEMEKVSCNLLDLETHLIMYWCRLYDKQKIKIFLIFSIVNKKAI